MHYLGNPYHLEIFKVSTVEQDLARDIWNTASYFARCNDRSLFVGTTCAWGRLRGIIYTILTGKRLGKQ